MMQTLLDVLDKAIGRDKLYRTTQYACKLASWGMQQNYKNYILIEKLNKLEKHTSLTRKVLRLGRFLHSFKNAQKSMNLLDPILKVTLSTFYINQTIHIFLDHYLWMGKIGLLEVDKKWETTSAKFFHMSICISIIRDLYLLHQTLIRLQTTSDEKSGNLDVNLALKVCYYNIPATLDLIRNIFDLPLPGSKLGYFPNHGGLVAFSGLVSSLIGIFQLINPNFKPKP